jgi:hypothetical protein
VQRALDDSEQSPTVPVMASATNCGLCSCMCVLEHTYSWLPHQRPAPLVVMLHAQQVVHWKAKELEKCRGPSMAVSPLPTRRY